MHTKRFDHLFFVFLQICDTQRHVEVTFLFIKSLVLLVLNLKYCCSFSF